MAGWREEKTEKKCDRCKERHRQQGSRFCPTCHGIVEREMKTSGYLTFVPRSEYRSPDAREKQHETKRGS